MYRETQEKIPPLTAEPIMVYRCGAQGQRYHSIKGAYLAAARRAFRAANPCDCETSFGFTQPPYYCGCSDREEEAEKKLIPRLARWLRWRDGLVAARENL